MKGKGWRETMDLGTENKKGSVWELGHILQVACEPPRGAHCVLCFRNQPEQRWVYVVRNYMLCVWVCTYTCIYASRILACCDCCVKSKGHSRKVTGKKQEIKNRQHCR